MCNRKENDMGDIDEKVVTETVGHKIGRAVGTLFAYILAGCVCATVVALTVKFIMWLF